MFISIHAAREGGDTFTVAVNRRFKISIHAAREGGDLAVEPFGRQLFVFQSTPPVKAATIKNPGYKNVY